MSNKAVLIIVAFILLVAVTLWVSVIAVGPRPSRVSATSASLTAGERAEIQKHKDKACNTVSRLQTAGAFSKVQGGFSGVSHAYVDRGFYEVGIDEKASVIRWVALCHIKVDQQNQLGVVIVHDGRSGKRIGSFDFSSGLQME